MLVAGLEMRLYLRMFRIPLTARVSNNKVLNRFGKEVEMQYEIERRRLEYFGHVLRNGK